MREEVLSGGFKEAPLLLVENLIKTFPVKGGRGGAVHAVNGISFAVNPGETFGLVGESGCGKTTAGRVIMGLTAPSGGKVIFNGKDMFAQPRREAAAMRKDMQMVFQDPFASLDPRMTIGKAIEEPLVIHRIGTAESRRKTVEDFLEIVGLQKSYYSRFPHEFSGGQRQRIGIARALILRPKLVICDEPVSALDVSVQSQILNLLLALQRELGLTYVFIAHGLNVVKYVSDWIGVMYLGKMMEIIPSNRLFVGARHPYTRALLSAVPTPDPTVSKERVILEGDIPSPTQLPTGCYFHTRCPYAREICRCQEPPVHQAEGRSMVACHFPLDGK